LPITIVTSCARRRRAQAQRVLQRRGEPARDAVLDGPGPQVGAPQTLQPRERGFGAARVQRPERAGREQLQVDARVGAAGARRRERPRERGRRQQLARGQRRREPVGMWVHALRPASSIV
jgi:hypothetical protein